MPPCAAGFSESDWKKLNKVFDAMKSLTASVTSLKAEVREANRIIHEQAKLISSLINKLPEL